MDLIKIIKSQYANISNSVTFRGNPRLRSESLRAIKVRLDSDLDEEEVAFKTKLSKLKTTRMN